MSRKRAVKSPSRLEYFPFFPKNWLSSPAITLMSPEEEGAYIRLLAHCWDSEDCAIPGDDKSLAKLSRLGERWLSDGSAIAERNLVRECFIAHPTKPGWLTNKKLLETKEKILDSSNERVVAGRKGAKTRWKTQKEKESLSHSSAIAQPIATDSILNLKLESKLKEEKSKKPRILLSDEDWMAQLKANPIYTGIDLDHEWRKASAWYPEHHRKLTRAAFINWLIKAMDNKPLTAAPKKRILYT